MSETSTKRSPHRNIERYVCPPFFSARIKSDAATDENATIENLSLRGLSARTSAAFTEGAQAEVEVRSTYVAPVKVYARVRWVTPPECEGSSHVVGFSIHRIRFTDWFRFMKLIAQVRKELW
ncbi:PilZ domain-containing protein [Candidatus Poribacteria bacterium]|nr:PilZ domain-containing protein [Candidatus Poribacteria bacterium]